MPLQAPIILPYGPSRDLNVHISFPADATPTSDGLPALVFFHGGGLFVGNAEMNDWAPKWLFEELSKKGVAIISAEYTLLLPYAGYELIADIKSLWTYIGTSLNTALAEKTSLRINTERLAVAGSSAGGYMTYLSVLYAPSTPAKPLAALPIYGMGGCYLSDFYLAPKVDGSLGQWEPTAPENDVAEFVASPPAGRTVRTVLDGTGSTRHSVCSWTLKWGNFLDVLTGVKGLSEKLRSSDESSWVDLLKEARALFPECLVSSNLPPFYLLHGQSDTLVLVSESRNMAKKLTEAGVKVKLIEVPNAEHGFDNAPAEDDKDGSAYEAMKKKYLLPLAESFSGVFL